MYLLKKVNVLMEIISCSPTWYTASWFLNDKYPQSREDFKAALNQRAFCIMQPFYSETALKTHFTSPSQH